MIAKKCLRAATDHGDNLAVGLATENPRRPNLERRCRGTMSWWRLAASVVDLQQSRRYWGALPCRHRWTVTSSLYTGYAEEHPANGARSEADVSSRGRTCEFNWQSEQQYLAHSKNDQRWPLSTRPARCCSHRLGMKQRHIPMPLQTQRQANDEFFESGFEFASSRQCSVERCYYKESYSI